MAYNISYAGDESDETEFSRVPCEGCGSRLAGFRHTASVLGSE